MHDPMVVAFTIRRPFPERRRPSWTPTVLKGKRVGWRIGHLKIGRVEMHFPELATIWHNEPGGRDSGEVCKHHVKRPDGSVKYTKRWKYHVHHWKIQVRPMQKILRFLVDRCELCGRRFPYSYSPVSHQWDNTRKHFWEGRRHVYHSECSALGSLRNSLEQRDALLLRILDKLREETGEERIELADRLSHHSSDLEFHEGRTVMHILGFERHQDHYETLVPLKEKT